MIEAPIKGIVRPIPIPINVINITPFIYELSDNYIMILVYTGVDVLSTDLIFIQAHIHLFKL